MKDTSTHFVELNRDHPGFRDQVYRVQRNEIADQARKYWEMRDQQRELPMPEIGYLPEQHKIWEQVYKQVSKLIEKNVESEIVEGFRKINFSKSFIPRFSDVNKKLYAATKIRLVPVEGLVKPRHFFASLAKGEFYCTQYIRHGSRPDFTPEPDICHDMMGHVPLLMSPRISAASIMLAKAACVCPEEDMPDLEKIYWFTFEYGLCIEEGKVKTYGAGNISSFADLGRCVDSNKVKHLEFNIEEIVKTDYDPTIQQPQLFLAQSLNYAMDKLSNYLSKRYSLDLVKNIQ